MIVALLLTLKGQAQRLCLDRLAGVLRGDGRQVGGALRLEAREHVHEDGLDHVHHLGVVLLSFGFGLFLFCFVLFCFVLFCFVLFCFGLVCFVVWCFVFCFVGRRRVGCSSGFFWAGCGEGAGG